MINRIKESPCVYLTILMLVALAALSTHLFLYNYKGKYEGESGLHIKIDYGTGCQYLRAGIFGGLHKRLDHKGNHICKDNHGP